MKTALALFHARGYDAVGVAELGEAIGVKAPSLYAAFGSKKGLFERALARYLEDEGDFVARTLAEAEPVAEVIPRLLRRAAEVYGDPAGLPGCLVLDGARNCSDPEVCALTGGLRGQGRALLRERIARDYPDGDYPGLAEALTDYVTVALTGLSGAARDGLAADALLRSAQIAGDGFTAQLPKEG
ncbi:MAG: TetR/AcrR family transcriptional regulator [Kiloniellaceae bacterium]